jgi:broad specificity phosphatase PhoE
MPRIFVVRHGESQDNLLAARLTLLLRKGRINEAEFKRRHDTEMSPEGDTPLSERGHDQAAALGAYYAPILHDLASKGRLHFYVSPFLRNLQTANPLLTELRKQLPNLKATVKTTIGEVPGLVDQHILSSVKQMAEAGDLEGARQVPTPNYKSTHDFLTIFFCTDTTQY